MRRRINRREAIPRDLPGTIMMFLKDEQFLIAFCALSSSRMIGCRSGGIRARKSPARTELDDLDDGELDVQRDRLEDRIVGMSYGRRTDRRLAIGRHKHAVLGVKGHHGARARCIQRLVVFRKQRGDSLSRRAQCVSPRFWPRPTIGPSPRFTLGGRIGKGFSEFGTILPGRSEPSQEFLRAPGLSQI